MFFLLQIFFLSFSQITPVTQWYEVGSCTHWCETGWYSSPAYAVSPDDSSQGMVVGSAYSIYALDVDTGEELWKVQNPAEGRAFPGVIRIYDWIEEGDLIFVTGHSGGYVCAWDHTGVQKWCTQVASNEVRGLTLGQLKSDGPYYVFAGIAVSSNQDLVKIIDPLGNVLNSRPRPTTDGYPDGWCWYQCGPNIGMADVTGDGNQEFFQPCDTHYITAYDSDLEPLTSNEKYDAGGDHKIWGRVGFNQYEAVDIRGWGHDGLRPNFCHCAVSFFDLPSGGGRKITFNGNYHDITTNINQYHTVFVVNPDRSRYVDATLDFNWTYTPDNPNWIAQDYNIIESVMPNVAPVDIDGDGYAELIYPNNDGYLHCNWLDKEEKHSWPYQTTESYFRFASEVAVFRMPDSGAYSGWEVIDRTFIVFSTWGEKESDSKGYVNILDGRGDEAIPRFEIPGAEDEDTNGALGAPTLFFHTPKTSNLLLTIQTINSGNVLIELEGTENAEILWGTGRGSYFRDGRFHDASSTYIPYTYDGDDDNENGSRTMKTFWPLF